MLASCTIGYGERSYKYLEVLCKGIFVRVWTSINIVLIEQKYLIFYVVYFDIHQDVVTMRMKTSSRDD